MRSQAGALERGGKTQWDRLAVLPLQNPLAACFTDFNPKTYVSKSPLPFPHRMMKDPYDPLRCMIEAQWGICRASLGILLAITVGFYLPTYAYHVEPDVLVASGYNGLIMVFGGKFFWAMIPIIAGAVIWCILWDKPPLVVCLNIAALQAVNTAMSGEGRMNACVVVLLVVAVFTDALALTLGIMRRKEQRSGATENERNPTKN